MKLRSILFALAIVCPSAAFACSYDSDCSPGSKCVKDTAQPYGVCMGGMYPGNKNDMQPAPSYTNSDQQTYGDTCSLDSDCGPGLQCRKDTGALDGVCIRAR